MELASRLDEFGKPAWIVATVAAFWLYWPVGFAILLFLVFSGRARAWRSEARGRWYEATSGQDGGSPWGKAGCWSGKRGRSRGRAAPSGNKAFDEYRDATITRLEDEQREFVEYLERLRQARDKAEFDQFMADRRKGGAVGPAEPPVPN